MTRAQYTGFLVYTDPVTGFIKPCSSAIVTIYNDGTTTPISQPMYPSPTSGVAKSNPFTVGSDGYLEIWCDFVQYVKLSIAVSGVGTIVLDHQPLVDELDDVDVDTTQTITGVKILDNGIDFTAITTPAGNPASGKVRVFPLSTTGRFMRKDSVGVLTGLAGPYAATLTVAPSNASGIVRANADYSLTGTNDQVIINTALAALPSGGGRILIMEGLVSISDQITPTVSNVTIEGMGIGTTIIQATNVAGVNKPLVLLANTKNILRNITIDGNKAATSSRTSMVLVSVTASDCLLENIHAINSAGIGVTCSAAATIVSKVFVTSPAGVGFNISGPTTSTTSNQSLYDGCAVRSGATHGFSVDGDNVILSACAARANTGDGFHINGGAEGSVIQGCHSGNNGGYGFVSSSAGSIISGCFSYSNTIDGFSLASPDIQVISCHAISNGGNGFGFAQIRMLVVGCYAASNTLDGYSTANGVSFCSFVGNFAYLNSGSGFNINGPDAIVQGNISVQNANHGFRLVSNGMTITGNRAEDNGTVTASTYQGYVVSGNDNTIASNSARKGTAATNKQLYGLSIVAGTNNKIDSSNDFYDGGTAGEINDGGTNTRKQVRAQTSIQSGDTINTTASETNFSTNCVIPANVLFSIGKVIRVTARGTYSTLGSGTVTLQLKLKAGTTTLLDFGSITTAISISGRRWVLEADITVITTGGSGSFECAGSARIPTANDNVTAAIPHVGSITTVDTTASQTLQISAQHGASNAANTITIRQLLVEVMN